MNNLSHLFSEEGPLRKKLSGFEVRPSQAEMLEDVASCYSEEKIALIEAGTGTGKSLAYLIPALFWAGETGEATVISTNTIALQEQLIKKDIPFLLDALGLKIKTVLVKGMHNYLCKRRLSDLGYEKKFLNQQEFEEIERIEEWSQQNEEGSKSDLGFNPLPQTWEKVVAEAESCTHMRCPHFKECYFFKARAEAADAKLLVANHHLLFSDLSARHETNNYQDSCILPPYKRLILDEAHHIEDVATEHFAKKVNRFLFFRLINRLLTEKGSGKLKTLHEKLSESFPEVKRDQKMGALFTQLELDLPQERRILLEHLDALFRLLLAFNGGVEKLRFRGEHLQHPLWSEVQEKAKEASNQGRRWIQSLQGIQAKLEEYTFLKEKVTGIFADIQGVISRLEFGFEVLLDFVFSPENEEIVRWIEVTNKQNIHLILAKLDIATLLSEGLFTKFPTVVLCSATLATRRDFKFIKTQLGIGQAFEKIYDSPFDYGNQLRLMVPLDMPHPDAETFIRKASQKIEEAIEISKGGAFVLFTSYGMLAAARESLLPRLKAKGYPLLCQGDEASHHLLQRFKRDGRSVLFGTDSFWEGVDVQGDALRCVIIAKLPFIVPSDPLFEAKSEKMMKEGRSPFFEYSLPHAAMKFKQGFGRLIRSKTDRGCVICLDSRLATKGYGKVILGGLPPCPNIFETSEGIMQSMKMFYQVSRAIPI